MTYDEVVARLIELGEIEDPELYELEAIHRNTAPDRIRMLGTRKAWTEMDRGTGRSTRMLFRVLADASKGTKVAISAHTLCLATELAGRAKKWAGRLGLNPQLIQAVDRNKDLFGWAGYWYVDHDTE